MRSRTSPYVRSEAWRNHSVITVMIGTMTTVTRSASGTFIQNRTPMRNTNVVSWTARLMMPSCSSSDSASMSLVMRVMIRPAFSSVKKSSDSRWMCENTRTRRSFISFWPRCPVSDVR